MDPWHGQKGCSAGGPSHLHTSVSHCWLSCPSRSLTTVDTSFRRDPRGDRPRSPGPARPHWPARGTHKCKFSAFVSELTECCWVTVRKEISKLEDQEDQDQKSKSRWKERILRKKDTVELSLLFAASPRRTKRKAIMASFCLSWRRRHKSRHHQSSNFILRDTNITLPPLLSLLYPSMSAVTLRVHPLAEVS